MADIRVDYLNIFPVKALAALPIEESRVSGLGLELDRRWMLVDENGKFYSQREFPILGQCAVSIAGDAIHIETGGDATELPKSVSDGPSKQVQIWNDTVEAIEGPPEATVWFTDLIGKSCTPVYLADEVARRVNPHFAPRPAFTSFTDGFPILVANQASLDELNERIGGADPLPMSRFRPNIVVSSTVPFDEDAWGRVEIGSAEIEGVKPCSRCVVTTIDAETAKMGKEPLKTLATFRKFGSSVYFAENFVVNRPGFIRVGDVATVLTRRSADEIARSRL